MNNKPLPVYGKGENVRDWLFVEDHARAIDQVCGAVQVVLTTTHNMLHYAIGEICRRDDALEAHSEHGECSDWHCRI